MGLRVAEYLAKKNTLREMVSWKVGFAHAKVLQALKEIASSRAERSVIH